MNSEKRSGRIFQNTVKEDDQFVVGNGNNGGLVRSIMQRRDDWQQVKQSQRANFKWWQFPKGFNFFFMTGRQIVNHFEYHFELSNKNLLLHNLQVYCQKANLNPFDICPISFVLDFNQQYLQHSLITFMELHSQIDQSLKNGIKEHVQIDIKGKLFKNVNYAKLQEIKELIAIKNSNRDKLPVQDSNTYLLKPSLLKTNLWIIKPSNHNQGNGISLFKTIEQLIQYLQQQDMEDQNKNKAYIIQKYIERPMLIRGRKFDLRVWVLFTHNMEVLVYREGYARTSSQPYSLQDTKLQTHLTNNSIQIHTAKYSLYQPGNQLSFKQVSEYLCQKDFKFQELFEKIKRIIKLGSESVKNCIDRMNRKFCFEIFGWDFMIDQTGQVWLIQVNTNPTLQQNTMLLKYLIPRMLNDALKLTIDVLFNSKSSHIYKLANYGDDENLWEKVCWLGKYKVKRKW